MLRRTVLLLALVVALVVAVRTDAQEPRLISDAGVRLLADIEARGMRVGTASQTVMGHMAPRWADNGQFVSLREWRGLYYELGITDFTGMALINADGACNAWMCLEYIEADALGWLWYAVRLTDAARREIEG